MAQFQTDSGTKVEEICIDSSPDPTKWGAQRQIHLELSPWGHDKPPEFNTLDTLVRVGGISFSKGTRKTSFWIEPTKDARGVDIVSAGGIGAGGATLRVTVGKVTNQYGMKCDLIAELGRSDDPRILRVYQRILAARNNSLAIAKDDWDRAPTDKHPGLGDQPLKQITYHKRMREWNCGTVLNQFALKNFGAAHHQFGQVRYYKPFRSKYHQDNRVLDIEFDADKVRRGVQKIRELLDTGTAVTVYAVHGTEGFGVKGGGEITNPGTHYLTIVGYGGDGNTFLVIDPWPKGSIITYSSGIFGDIHSLFMRFIYYRSEDNRIASESIQDARSPHQMVNGQMVTSYEGNHGYVVLTGPG